MLDSLHDVRLIQNPAVGDNRNHSDDLKRRDADLLTHRDRSNRTLGPARCRLGQTALFPRQIDVCGLSKTHAVDVAGESLIAESQSKLDGANVGGLLHDLLYSQKTVALVIVYQSAEHNDRTHLTIDDVGRRG